MGSNIKIMQPKDSLSVWQRVVGLLDLPRQVQELLAHPLSRRRRFKVIQQWAFWHIGSRLVSGPVLVPFVNGTRLLAGRGLTNVNWNYYTGLAEPAEMTFLAHYLRREDVLFDVGANAGVVTILAAAASGCRCISFEPFPDSVEALRLHVRLNGFDDLVTLVPIAVGDATGTCCLSVDAGPMNHVVSSTTAGSDRHINVAVTTLDQEVSKFGFPNVLKIDVEGYESAVLAGASRALQSPRLRAIVVEINQHAARYGHRIDDIFDQISVAGFIWVTYNIHSRELIRRNGPATGGTHIFVRDFAEAAERTIAAPPLRGIGFSL